MVLFQSSRPVAGARIPHSYALGVTISCFNPRAPLPGRASFFELVAGELVKVSILAPRCRGAHPGRDGITYDPASFNPRAPLPGRASLDMIDLRAKEVFQSSRPVAGARIRRAGQQEF